MPVNSGNVLSLTFPDGASYANMTSYEALLKEYYGPQVVHNLVYTNNPGFAMLPKHPEVSGLVYPLPVIFGNPQGRSATFTNAQGNQTASANTRFILQMAADYQLVTVTGMTAAASRNDQGAFVSALKNEMDNGFKQIKNSISGAIFRSGTGSIGKIATGGITSGVITLSNPDDVTQFEVNQTLQANATDGGTPRATLGYVIGVDRGSGIVTVSDTGLGGAAGTPVAWQAADFLLVQGDNNLKVKGFNAWLPATVTATPFFGVDRTGDATRLGGIRWDGSGQPIEEALVKAAALCSREDGNPTTVVLPFSSYSSLELSLGSKVQYTDRFVDDVVIPFRGIRLHGPNAELAIFPDRSCIAQTAFMLETDSWGLYSYGEVPHIVDLDVGSAILRVPSADAFEVRLRYFAQMGCNAPGHNARVTLSA